MITVLIPSDKEFKKYKSQIRKIYSTNQSKIKDPNSFDFILKNTLFYAFFLDGSFIGAIYYFKEKEKLYLNGFATSKHHLENLYCLKLSTTWFKKPIYAEAQNRASSLCLLRCGFKRVDGNIFILQR